MDTVINDLVVQNQLEILLGPVVFKNFLLNKDGRYKNVTLLILISINNLKLQLEMFYLNSTLNFGRGFLKNRHACFELSHSIESSLRSLSTL